MKIKQKNIVFIVTYRNIVIRFIFQFIFGKLHYPLYFQLISQGTFGMNSTLKEITIFIFGYR